MSARPDRQITHRRHQSYIDKSREYYAAQGYEQAYRWASFDDVPFRRPAGSLDEARVAVVTTSYPEHHEGAHGAPATDKVVYHRPSEPFPTKMYTGDLSWDKDATHTDDVESFLPLATLTDLAADGVIGSLNDRFFGVPTEYSQRKTGVAADQIAEWCLDDSVDVALLVPL